MLVLSRRIGERIVVPQCRLSITVVAVKGKTVRLAFSAPADIHIEREELSCPARLHLKPANP